jgi:hypothetical protein
MNYADNFTVVGGGSLKKRLGDNKLSSIHVIPERNSILLCESVEFQ